MMGFGSLGPALLEASHPSTGGEWKRREEEGGWWWAEGVRGRNREQRNGQDRQRRNETDCSRAKIHIFLRLSEFKMEFLYLSN